MPSELDTAEQFERQLNSPKQTWLLGAGVSFNSNIPLMVPLTVQVLKVAREKLFADDALALRVIDYVQNDIVEDAHIEIFLTHLSDLISLSERARTNTISLGADSVSKSKLTRVHVGLLGLIAETVRWGFKPEIRNDAGEIVAQEIAGTPGKSIVEIDEHLAFVDAIFGANRAGLERYRGAVELFTTNYDTLLEDALALKQIEYCDGFSGGGLGFWSPKVTPNVRARVTKLHGSIDWFRPAESPSPLLRTRYGDKYPGKGGAVLIYPQATKYLNAQIDPFSALFGAFRERLADGTDQVLLVCGYSFGDDHINADIELAMANSKSQLAMVAFVNETDTGLPSKLETWRRHTSWKNRLYIVSPRGLYQGAHGPFFAPQEAERNWWTFSGATELFSKGLPKDIQEALQ